MAAAGAVDILSASGRITLCGTSKSISAVLNFTLTLPYIFYYGKEGKSKSYPCQARLFCRHWL